jgi:LysR family transcriptional regulator, low CO2-responsive transcriptional regulator
LETKRLSILDVQDFPIIRHWHVVHRKNKRLSSVAQAFREFLLKEAPALMPGITGAKD